VYNLSEWYDLPCFLESATYDPQVFINLNLNSESPLSRFSIILFTFFSWCPLVAWNCVRDIILERIVLTPLQMFLTPASKWPIALYSVIYRNASVYNVPRHSPLSV
jgi:hypothetical protein